VGKISYGVYIYHLGFSYGFGLLITTVFHSAINKLPVVAQCGAMVVYLCLVFLLAEMSYRFWEVRFLKMRNHISILTETK
jgi:peptidoglycan/LPS O-acetylase OafA/YrhL